MPYSSQYATCAGREIHYTEWGAQNPPRSSPGTAWPAPAATWTNWPSIFPAVIA